MKRLSVQVWPGGIENLKIETGKKGAVCLEIQISNESIAESVNVQSEVQFTFTDKYLHE